MSNNNLEILYRLLREHLHVIGTSRTTLMALESFIASLKELRCSKENIREQISGLAEAIKSGKPRIAPLINLIVLSEREFENRKIFDRNTVDAIKNAAIAVIGDQMLRLKQSTIKIVDLGVHYVENEDFIIIHSFSSPILKIFSEAKRLGKDFRILILKQDFIKTKQVIKYMDKEDVAHVVIPEYNLSHFVDKATKLFLGAISITRDNKALCSMGTTSIASIAHLNRLPVYLFVDSLKISTEKHTDQNIFEKREILYHDGVQYTQIAHSHEIVDLDLINYLITEEGEIDKKDISKYMCEFET
ncbi:MAG: hypothetical protein JW883_06815 [Deltaproteobacteria bacterium]|nr:hypothetical protein [Deltaproteobacteria bacterium]